LFFFFKSELCIIIIWTR